MVLKMKDRVSPYACNRFYNSCLEHNVVGFPISVLECDMVSYNQIRTEQQWVEV